MAEYDATSQYHLNPFSHHITTMNKPPYSQEQEMDLNSGIAAFESREFSKAMQLLNPFAQQGDAVAQYRVSIMQQNGLGVVRNELQAFKMMKLASEQGYPLAQHGLGFMYLEGDCIDKNGDRAAHWFTQAAEQGLVGSATTLAMMYEQGNEIEQDLELAKKWYRHAGFDDKANEIA